MAVALGVDPWRVGHRHERGANRPAGSVILARKGEPEIHYSTATALLKLYGSRYLRQLRASSILQRYNITALTPFLCRGSP
eukprot:5334178-Prymnesium_polylepis.1